MSEEQKIAGTAEAWESEALGASEAHVKVADAGVADAIDASLGLQMISIRLDRELIRDFKMMAEHYRVGYQPLMRDALKRFADSEMRFILEQVLEAKREEDEMQREAAAKQDDHKEAA